MSIKFNVIERGKPGDPASEKKFYAIAVSDGELTLEGLTKTIEKISTVSGADIRAVLYAMVDVMKDALGEGKIVRLGDLGSLRISISSDGEAEADKVTSSTIRGAKTIFTPGNALKETLKLLKYEKA